MLYVALLKAVLCSIIGFYNRKRNPSSYFLLMFLCLLILFDFNLYLQTEGVNKQLLLIFFLHTSPLSMLLGPLLYIYVRNTLTDRNRLYWYDLIHLIPFLLVTLDFMPYYRLSWAEKRVILNDIAGNMNAVMSAAHGRILNNFQYALFRWTVWLTYLLIILYMLYRRRPGRSQHLSIPVPQYTLIYRWLLTLSLLFVAVLLPNLKVILDNHSGRVSIDGTGYVSTPAFILSITIYVIACLSILMYPQILYGMPRSTLPLPESGAVTSDSPDDRSIEAKGHVDAKVVEAQINEEPFVPLANAIESYIRIEKPYLDPEFSISTISHRFKVPQHHVHYCFSKIIQCGFPAYKNRLRVEYAKDLLAGEHGRQLTIDGIGKQSGFSAKMNFYTAFKKETGMTPRQYLESMGADPRPDQT